MFSPTVDVHQSLLLTLQPNFRKGLSVKRVNDYDFKKGNFFCKWLKHLQQENFTQTSVIYSDWTPR